MTHINYNGSAPALTDVIAGRVPIMFDVWHSAKRYVDSGELKLIAGAGAPRLADAPNVPTINETYPGFDVIAFNAMIAPAGNAEAGAGEARRPTSARWSSCPSLPPRPATSASSPKATRRPSSTPGCAGRPPLGGDRQGREHQGGVSWT